MQSFSRTLGGSRIGGVEISRGKEEKRGGKGEW